MKRKLLAFFILVSMALLLACTDDARPDAGVPDASAAENGGGQAGEDIDPRLLIPDGLEERDFGGREFVIATRDDTAGPTCRHRIEVYAETLTGEALNDAVYRRNALIEERFNAVIVPRLMYERDEGTLTRELLNAVRAGDSFADVAIGHMINMSAVALQNVFLNWNDVPNIGFGKPWWNESATRELQVAGVSFFAFSDMLVSGYDSTYAIAFNHVLSRDFGLDFPYDAVREGRWTIDMMHEMTRDIYMDLDGTGVVSYHDLFGFAGNAFSGAAAWPWAFNQFVTRPDAGGFPEIILNNEKSAQIVLKMYDFFFNTPGWSIVTEAQRAGGAMWWDYVRSEMFPQDRAVFGQIILGDTLLFREMESDFGILPLPKWDERQENYLTMIDGHGPLMGIPVTAADNLDMIGTIMTAMAAESFRHVLPAYYYVAFHNMQLRDEDSIEMLDNFIRPGVVFDFGFIFDGWSGFGFWLDNILRSRSTDFASFFERHEPAVTRHYERVIEAHLNPN